MPSPISSSPAAALAAQQEAAAQGRQQANNRKPPVRPVKEGEAASSYLQHRRPLTPDEDENRGHKVDQEA